MSNSCHQFWHNILIALVRFSKQQSVIFMLIMGLVESSKFLYVEFEFVKKISHAHWYYTWYSKISSYLKERIKKYIKLFEDLKHQHWQFKTSVLVCCLFIYNHNKFLWCIFWSQPCRVREKKSSQHFEC